MKKMMMILVMVMIAAVCFAQDYPVRTWTKKNGQTVEGSFEKRFVREKSGKDTVMIRTPEGKQVGMTLKQLSEEDVAYVNSLAK